MSRVAAVIGLALIISWSVNAASPVKGREVYEQITSTEAVQEFVNTHKDSDAKFGSLPDWRRSDESERSFHDLKLENKQIGKGYNSVVHRAHFIAQDGTKRAFACKVALKRGASKERILREFGIHHYLQQKGVPGLIGLHYFFPNVPAVPAVEQRTDAVNTDPAPVHPTVKQIEQHPEDYVYYYFELGVMNLSEFAHFICHSVAEPAERVAVVRYFGLELAKALDKMHLENVVHRDMKMENVVVGVGGEPKIIDFGGAQMMPGMRTADYYAPPHMAPEVRELNDLADPDDRSKWLFNDPQAVLGITKEQLGVFDPVIDAWSLGYVLYVLHRCRNEPPFELIRKEDDDTTKGRKFKLFIGGHTSLDMKELDGDSAGFYHDALEVKREKRRKHFPVHDAITTPPPTGPGSMSIQGHPFFALDKEAKLPPFHPLLDANFDLRGFCGIQPGYKAFYLPQGGEPIEDATQCEEVAALHGKQ